jgi:hypothetical protein
MVLRLICSSPFSLYIILKMFLNIINTTGRNIRLK